MTELNFIQTARKEESDWADYERSCDQFWPVDVSVGINL